MAEIGATLREARMRARIDVSEIETRTKIRAKYLRALENEEWNLLPGPAYVRSFLREYADALGLDSRVLLEDYRREYERPSDVELAPIGPPGRRRAEPPRRSSRGYLIAIGVLLVVIALTLVGLLAGGSGGRKASTITSGTKRPVVHHRKRAAPPARAARSAVVSLQLNPTAPVYVCLVASGGRKLIDKVTLQPGGSQPIYRSRRFDVTVGNSSLTMKVDGKVLTVPASNNPTGYVITAHGRRTLPLGRLPTCA